MLLFVQLFVSRVLSHCKHECSFVINAETLERAPTPSWQTCKVLRPWAVFRDTMVEILLLINSLTTVGYLLEVFIRPTLVRIFTSAWS